MEKKLIVILVSEQTVPNVQFLKWYFKNYLQTVDLLFVSTSKMEEKQKSGNILKALEYLSKYINESKVVCVNENSIDDLKEKVRKLLSEWEHSSFAVSITGGTKIMSLASYDFFKEQENCEIFYQPLNQNLQKLYPAYADFSVSQLLTLEEYMKAHGISFKYNNKCLMNYEFNSTVYEKVIKDNRDAIKPIIALQNNSYFKNIFKRKDSVNLLQVPDEKFVTPEGNPINKDEVIDAVKAFGLDIENLSRDELRYITGGWFEEFVYQKVKVENKLSDENIALNVHIEKGHDKNELDVVYIQNNRLHVIECKSFLEGSEGTWVLNDALYKLQAIMKSKFGLNALPYLYTQSIVEKETALNRAKEFGIEIVDGNSLQKH